MFLLEIGFCDGTAKVWHLVGNLLSVFKIVIPILIIIFGMIDLGKAVIASKDDEIKKAAKQILFRIIAGLVIFFIPDIVGFAFSLANGFDSEGDYNICKTCITEPESCPK